MYSRPEICCCVMSYHAVPCHATMYPYPRSCSPCSHSKLRSVPRSSSLTDLAPCPCIKVPFITFRIRIWGLGACRCPTMSQADSLLFRKSTSGVVCRRLQSCSCFSVLSLGRLHSRVLASSSIRIVEHNLGHQNVHSLSHFPPTPPLPPSLFPHSCQFSLSCP